MGKVRLRAEAIPPSLVVARFFLKEGAAVEATRARLDAVAGDVAAMLDEHGGEDGVLANAAGDKDKITVAGVVAGIKALRRLGLPYDDEIAEEQKVLNDFLAAATEMSRLKIELVVESELLTGRVIEQYKALTDDEARTLVVDDKWLAAIAAAIETELDRLTGALTRRVRTLGERYVTTLLTLEDSVESLSVAVEAELKKMGFAWSRC